ncbi:MAG: YciI family protein [Micromonosporaceae bacterium]
MKYLLLLCGDETAAEHAADPTMAERCHVWATELQARGVTTSGIGLRPPDEATTVRVRDTEVLLIDGPFAETKDQIGGLNLIECDDLDQAIEAASTHPWATVGTIEVRPVEQP